jgi:hypothetical protein
LNLNWNYIKSEDYVLNNNGKGCAVKPLSAPATEHGVTDIYEELLLRAGKGNNFVILGTQEDIARDR